MEPHDRDQFDDLLAGSLKRYGEVEPRAGLEGRVLARLAAVDREPRLRMYWGWGLTAAACIGMVIALGFEMRPRPHEQPVAVHPPSAAVNSTVPHDVPAPTHRKPRTTVARRDKVEPEVAKTRLPSEFPSPHPLTEQERLLKVYVDNFPQEAALVAHEQAERDKELAAMGWKNSGIPDLN